MITQLLWTVEKSLIEFLNKWRNNRRANTANGHMQCELLVALTSITRWTFRIARYYREYCYRQFFAAVNQWKRNSLPGTQLFLPLESHRHRGWITRRKVLNNRVQPSRARAVILNVCRVSYVPFHFQLYNFIIRVQIANCFGTISNWDISYQKLIIVIVTHFSFLFL